MCRQIIVKRIEIGRTWMLNLENCVCTDIYLYWYEILQCLSVENSLLNFVLAFYKHPGQTTCNIVIKQQRDVYKFHFSDGFYIILASTKKIDTNWPIYFNLLEKGTMLSSQNTTAIQLKYKSRFYSVVCNKLLLHRFIPPFNNKQSGW
jgi:hypothetical protein